MHAQSKGRGKIRFFPSFFGDSSGHIIATDCCNGVYVFNLSGECVGHVSSDVIKSPAGVDGFVHVCSFYACNVVVFVCSQP